MTQTIKSRIPKRAKLINTIRFPKFTVRVYHDETASTWFKHLTHDFGRIDESSTRDPHAGSHWAVQRSAAHCSVVYGEDLKGHADGK